MKQFLAAVLVAVLVLPSSCLAASSWMRFEDSQLFSDFLYHKSSGEWVSDDGEHYDSTTDLLDHYGFSYSDRFDVWYNEDGYIDEDMCVRDHSDGGYFYCRFCEIFMYDAQSDNPENHHDECAYIEEIGGYENEHEEDFDSASFSASDPQQEFYSFLHSLFEFIFFPLEALYWLVETGLNLYALFLLIIMVIFVLKGPYYIIKAIVDKIRNRKK